MNLEHTVDSSWRLSREKETIHNKTSQSNWNERKFEHVITSLLKGRSSIGRQKKFKGNIPEKQPYIFEKSTRRV